MWIWLSLKFKVKESKFKMGNIVSNRINPNVSKRKEKKIKNNPHTEISRRNFRFISKVSTTGQSEQSVVWLAENWDDNSELFFIKRTNKSLAWKHGRVESIKNELQILAKDSKNIFIMQPLFAFQDYGGLYLVHDFIESFTLEEVLREHEFTEEEAKYVVVGLIAIIEKLHQQKFAITQLSPDTIIVNKQTGEMKLFQLVNPLPVDSYYPSNMMIPLNPYVAPEILLMDRVRGESDYYSLGLILYYIMKNKPAISEQIQDSRMAVINQTIEVVKSDLPEGWKPEAADFLVKLLIKNPELRLGRYGSFELRNHAWLQNYTHAQSFTVSCISLNEDYFKTKKYKRVEKPDSLGVKEEINESYDFQIQFESYQHRIAQAENDSQSYDSIQEDP